MATIKDKCSVLKALSEATEPMRPAAIGERIGKTAFDAGQLLRDLRNSGLTDWADKKKHLHQITQRGRDWLATPPAELPPEPPTTTTKNDGTERELSTGLRTELSTGSPPQPPPVPPQEGLIPSQADIFRSVAEQLSISKAEEAKGGASLSAIINFVERTADMDDLDSIEKALIGMNVPAHLRKRWLTLYAQSLPTKDRHMSPELAEMLRLEEGEGKTKPPQPMYNVIEGKIYPDPDGDYTFSKAVQLVAAEKTSADPAALLTALMPILTKEQPQPPQSADPAALLTALMPLLTREPSQMDTSLLQSLQTRIEQLADERNKAQLDALRAEMRSGQRAPEADAQIQALSNSIETMREELHKQQLERIKEQHEATINLLTNKLTQLEQQVQASIQGKQVDSKYGLMSEGLKGILNEIGGARRDIKDIAPAFLQRSVGKPVRTPEQKASFDQGVEQAIERQKKSREMEDKLFFGKEG